MPVTEHGGSKAVKGIKYDFSANINPLGMPEEIKNAVISSAPEWEVYPDHFCSELRSEVSKFEKVPGENIVFGNGADDLIYRMAYAFRPEKALVCAPSFSEYKKALESTGCLVHEHFLREDNGFELTGEITGDIVRLQPDIVFICSPNNPTGKTADRSVLEKTVRCCRENDIILVCDECFIDFSEKGRQGSVSRFMNENVIILRAFTKIYAMAGLRLGYAVCGSEKNASVIENTGQYWSVSVPAQKAGAAAAGISGFAEKTAEYVRAEREYLTAGLKTAGLLVYDSDVNYILLKGPEGLDDDLVSEGILIRNCSNYSGLGPGFFRIAVRTHHENEILIRTLRRVLKNG